MMAVFDEWVGQEVGCQTKVRLELKQQSKSNQNKNVS